MTTSRSEAGPVTDPIAAVQKLVGCPHEWKSWSRNSYWWKCSKCKMVAHENSAKFAAGPDCSTLWGASQSAEMLDCDWHISVTRNGGQIYLVAKNHHGGIDTLSECGGYHKDLPPSRTEHDAATAICELILQATDD